MLKYYKIFETYTYQNSIRQQFELLKEFKNKFDTREEAVNFMLNKDNSHLFSEEEEYIVMEIFKKESKNNENENRI